MAASSLALKHIVSRSLLSRSLRPLRAVTTPVPIRLFCTTAARGYGSVNSDSNDGLGTDPRASFPPYGTTMNMGPGVDSVETIRKNMKGKDTFYGVFLRVDMPGVGKESVKVRIEKDTVIMKGEGQKDFEDDELGPRYYFSIQLRMVEQFNTGEVKATMANGVLKVFVPKFKVQAKTNVLHVTL